MCLVLFGNVPYKLTIFTHMKLAQRKVFGAIRDHSSEFCSKNRHYDITTEDWLKDRRDRATFSS